jgi:ribosomal protein L29
MAPAKKKTSKGPAAKKAATPKVKKQTKAPKAKVAKKSEAAEAKTVTLENMDRKALASRARELKRELMGIRFNQQNPSLTEFRRKKKELASLLGQLA